jgi:hypothetical protein
MAVASPALALATTTAQSFTFPRRTVVKIQVRFYTDAAATAGNELDVADGGSRTLTITTQTPVVSSDVTRAYSSSAVSAIENGALACAGATWTLFELGDGLNQLYVAATAGADPGTANSYRIWLDVEPNG